MEGEGTEEDGKQSEEPIDPYLTLDVSPDATLESITASYKRMCERYHPDKSHHQSDELKALAAKKFEQACEAYWILSDSRRRRAHDNHGKRGIQMLEMVPYAPFESLTHVLNVVDAREQFRKDSNAVAASGWVSGYMDMRPVVGALGLACSKPKESEPEAPAGGTQEGGEGKAPEEGPKEEQQPQGGTEGKEGKDQTESGVKVPEKKHQVTLAYNGRQRTIMVPDKILKESFPEPDGVMQKVLTSFKLTSRHSWRTNISERCSLSFIAGHLPQNLSACCYFTASAVTVIKFGVAMSGVIPTIKYAQKTQIAPNWNRRVGVYTVPMLGLGRVVLRWKWDFAKQANLVFAFYSRVVSTNLLRYWWNVLAAGAGAVRNVLTSDEPSDGLSFHQIRGAVETAHEEVKKNTKRRQIFSPAASATIGTFKIDKTSRFQVGVDAEQLVSEPKVMGRISLIRTFKQGERRVELTTNIGEQTSGQITLSQQVTKLNNVGMSIVYNRNAFIWQLTFRRHEHILSIPLLLSSEYTPGWAAKMTCGLMTWAGMTTLLVVYPLMWMSHLNTIRKTRKEQRSYLRERRKKALEAQHLMETQCQRSIQYESMVPMEGLIIVNAIYGCLHSDQPPAAPAQADDPGAVMKEAHAGSIEPWIDVTIPCQVNVQKSRLDLPPRSKATMDGFYDPDPDGNEPKSLLIKYRFRGKMHQVELEDLVQLTIPQECHLLPDEE